MGCRDRARISYDDANERYIADNKRWTKKGSTYYSHSTDQLLPTQHADLSRRALDLADAARKVTQCLSTLQHLVDTYTETVLYEKTSKAVF